MDIYTRRGDQGKTDLFSGERVEKYNIQVEAYGVIDELNSCLGISRSKISESEIAKLLQEIQQQLFVVGAELASRNNNLKQTTTDKDVSYLEAKIDFYKEKVNLKNSFSVPGNSEYGSFLDLARTICRRAERRIFELNDLEKYDLNNYLLEYINRLSDLLFILSKVVDNQKIKEEKMKINLERANKMVEAAKKEAAKIEVPMVISIVDGAGKLISLERMDKALQVSIGLSRQKAYTAVVMKNTTEEVGKLAQPGNELYGIEVSVPDLVTFGGGIPILDDEEVVGAIGVSGGAVEEDMQVAQAGIDCL